MSKRSRRAAPASATQYRILNGLQIQATGRELAKGEIIAADVIPEQSVGWLLEQGHIEPADGELAAPPAAHDFVDFDAVDAIEEG